MYLRKGNIQFYIKQNNQEKTFIIDGFKKAVDDRREGDYFGYEEPEVKGNDFRKLLPSEITDIIEDNVEFSHEGCDLKEVLDKVINFKIVSQKNQLVEMNIYTERQISDMDNFNFQVTLEPKIHLREKVKSIIDTISTVQDVYHKQTGLINSQCFPEILDEIMDFLFDVKLEGVMLIVTLEGFPNFRRENGKEKADEILEKIGVIMRSNFRARDIVGYLGLGKFAVVLIKTFEDETIYPIKRLESNLKKNGLLTSKLSYNARFKQIDLETTATDAIELIKNKELDYTISI
jgi:diguanylate cyclase (GGDEF)-like protein